MTTRNKALANWKHHVAASAPCDTSSVPPGVHRSFRSLDGDAGMLISILGGKLPDRVKWDSGLEQRACAIGAGFDDDGNAVKFD